MLDCKEKASYRNLTVDENHNLIEWPSTVEGVIYSSMIWATIQGLNHFPHLWTRQKVMNQCLNKKNFGWNENSIKKRSIIRSSLKQEKSIFCCYHLLTHWRVSSSSTLPHFLWEKFSLSLLSSPQFLSFHHEPFMDQEIKRKLIVMTKLWKKKFY